MNIKELLKFAFAYCGIVIGAGFATGQEIMQFFTNNGMASFISIIFSVLIMTFIFRQIAKVGYLYDVESHELPLNKLFGNVFGRILDYSLIFFMFVTSFIMLAGGGSNLNESFGMPTWVGTIVLIVLVSITLMLDFDKIINLLGIATPILLIMVTIMSIYAFSTADMTLSEGATYADSTVPPWNNWWIDAIVYAGLMFGVGFSFITIMGSDTRLYEVVKRGSLLGGFFVLILLLLVNGSLLLNMDSAVTKDVPSLVVANAVHPIFGSIYSIVIIVLIYNTVVALMYAVLVRFTRFRSKQYVILLVVLMIVSFFLTRIGFVTLINIFYPLYGYLGIIIAIGYFVLWVRKKVQRSPYYDNTNSEK